MLKNYAYYATGGSYKNMYSPSSPEEVSQLIKLFKKEKIPYFVLGKGSNSLVMDDFWPGAVLMTHHLQKWEIEKRGLRVGAGVENSILVEKTKNLSIKNFAWMSGLPGSLGGTVRMNARCYGGEISREVLEIVMVNSQGEIEILKNDSHVFRGYKDTIFMQHPWIITEVLLKIEEGSHEEIDEKQKSCLEDRTRKGHYFWPSCGCVFKNNREIGVSSGFLLDKAGVKGWQEGKAKVSSFHGNFIYNCGGAKALDILKLSLAMRNQVWEKFGVWLEYEMEILGSLPENWKNFMEEKRNSFPYGPHWELLRQEFQKSRGSVLS